MPAFSQRKTSWFTLTLSMVWELALRWRHLTTEMSSSYSVYCSQHNARSVMSYVALCLEYLCGWKYCREALHVQASRLEHANAAIVFISFQGSKILVTNTITCVVLNDWGTISISEPKRVVKTLAVSVWHTAMTSVWIALAYATFSSFVTRANTFPETTSHFFVLCHKRQEGMLF